MVAEFHILRKESRKIIYTDFLFYDTETRPIKNENGETHYFNILCSKYWNSETDYTEERIFRNLDSWWDYVTSLSFELIIIAHNQDFDFKITNGFEQLFNRGFEVDFWHINGTTWILHFTDGQMDLKFWDTMNYTPESLKNIGKSLKFPKLEIDFDEYNFNEEELIKYCKRDVDIIYVFIKKLMGWLVTNDLGNMKSTAGSLSKSIFLRKFYKPNKTPIYIHNFKKVVSLERESYSGGITDCFRLGKAKETIYKLDINSMYPYIMKTIKLPTKCIFWSNDLHGDLNKVIDNCYENKYLFIARCDISLPEKYAYILTKCEYMGDKKSMFVYGNYTTVLTKPEYEFIKKYGEINHVHEISVYECSNIYTEFVDYFYNMRLQYKNEGNSINEKFCKLILNSQYGKWGQKETIQEKIELVDDINVAFLGRLLIDREEKQRDVIQLGRQIYHIIKTDENSKDSFVAIASFVTANARMLLIKYLLTAKRENVYYCDTDSLFVNKTGLDNLQEYISNSELGLLKIEEISDDVEIIAPKHYVFNSIRKCKGVKLRDKHGNMIQPIKHTETEICFEQERWQRFKTAFKKDNLDCQVIENYHKTIKFKYDKGINDNGFVKPIYVGDING